CCLSKKNISAGAQDAREGRMCHRKRFFVAVQQRIFPKDHVVAYVFERTRLGETGVDAILVYWFHKERRTFNRMIRPIVSRKMRLFQDAAELIGPKSFFPWPKSFFPPLKPFFPRPKPFFPRPKPF